MYVHVFGGESSPSCSNYALQKTAEDNLTKDGTEVTENLNNFYVHDMLKSVSIEETTMKLIQIVRKICANRGFCQIKFVSNKKQVLASILKDEHSQVVTGYIRNTQRRFKTFVANRVQKIREYSDITQWNYVSPKINSADYASRGLSGSNSQHLDLWFSGPQFLWKSKFQIAQTSCSRY